MRKFAKCQNTEFRIFANIRIIAKFREIIYFRIILRMFIIAKDAKFRFARKPYYMPAVLDSYRPCWLMTSSSKRQILDVLDFTISDIVLRITRVVKTMTQWNMMPVHASQKGLCMKMIIIIKILFKTLLWSVSTLLLWLFIVLVFYMLKCNLC